MNEIEECCSICGDDTSDKYNHTLKCGHSFHYECLLLSFKNMKNNNCPYCRSTNNKLPIVNGVRKIIPWIHETYEENDPNMILNYKIKKCNYILTKGKNKGKQCERNCKLGFNYCQIHKKVKDKE
tara:strand:+ start:8639 stop:9013 length:375 start_codon:yes stop_codon:yes gene_type:complete